MCRYIINEHVCKITKTHCPYMYFCDKKNIWKSNKSIPKSCKVIKNAEIPEGYYRVREERKGYLFVDIGDCTYEIKNPFDEIPQFVKVSKTKNGYKIKK